METLDGPASETKGVCDATVSLRLGPSALPIFLLSWAGVRDARFPFLLSWAGVRDVVTGGVRDPVRVRVAGGVVVDLIRLTFVRTVKGLFAQNTLERMRNISFSV
jgi:hypothetical protein